MGNPIKFTELFDKAGIDAGIDALSKKIKQLEKTIKVLGEKAKPIVVTDPKASEQIRKISDEFKKQKTSIELTREAHNQLVKAKDRLKIANSDLGKETKSLQDSIQRQNRANVQANTLERERKGSMAALSVELAKNKQKYRELSAAQRVNVSIGGKLITTIRQQDANLKKLDASIGNNQRSVGNYGIALQGATRLLGALGLAGGITLVVRGLREMIGVFSGFEKQMAKVRAISGATDAEFKLLTDDAKRLGESTEKTASQVGELQLAYAKLGFTTPQIIAATEATLDLATATDEDLAQSALVAAKTIKGFNLNAEETVRVTDVMALSFSSSALTLNAFQDAMKTVAPVALAVNSTLESTTAVLSTLVDAGLDASTAGTSLRNIFIELETQGLSWDEAMEKVRNSTNKVKTATELFGKRASTAALIIANNSEKIETLTESYNNAAGSAKAMADIMRDTFIGDLDRSRSAVEGLVIQIGEKLTPFLRAATKGFTFFITNIKAFFKIIGIAGAGLAAYTLITKGATIAKRAYTIAVNIANIATKAFNTSVKANPLGLLIGLLAAAVAAFFAFRDSTDEATKSEENFGDELERGNKLLDERAKKLFDLENVFIKQGETLINLTNNLNNVIKITKEQIGFDKIRLEVLKDFIQQRKLSLKQQLLESKSELIKIGEEIQTLEGRRAATKQDVQQSKLSLKIFQDEIDANNKLLSFVNTRLKQLDKEDKEDVKRISRLKELQNQLKGQKLALEAITDETTEASEVAIIAGKADIKITQEKIDAILKVLSLKEEEKKKDKERFDTMKLEEAERVFQLELQEKLLLGEIERSEFVIESAKLRIDAIDFLMKKEIEGTEAFKKLEIEKLELIRDIEEEKKKIRKEELEEIKEFADVAIKGIIEGLNRRADAAIEAANTEIQATEKQISRQEALAAQGLENSLKFEQEQRAKALLAKIQAEKTKQTAEKISAFWNLVANSENVLEAIAKFGLGEAFARTIEALPGFEKGGETPDKPTLIIAGEKGREFIVKHEATEKYLPQLKAMNEGTYDNQLTNYIDNSRFIPQNIPTNDVQVQQLVIEMKAMRESFEKNMPKVESYFDASTKEIINIVKYQNKKKIIHYKVPTL